MYGIYANIGGILMGSMLPYIAYMDPMGIFHEYPRDVPPKQIRLGLRRHRLCGFDGLLHRVPAAQHQPARCFKVGGDP